MSRTKKATRASAPLAHYFRKALPPGFDDDIFAASPHLATPTLVNGQTNRILTYRGCFDPPHQGHMDALCHAFFRSGTDINIIAAIIYVLPAGSLAVKHHDKDSIPLLLTEDERISIINNSGIEGGWHWCFPRHIDEQGEFQAKVQEEAEKDGFEIDFVTLTGPDHVSELKPGTYWDRNTIVAGTGQPPRTNFRANNASGLSKVGGYSEWNIRPVDEKLLDALSGGGEDEWIRQKMLMLAPQNYHLLPPSGKVSSKAIAKFKKDLCALEPVRSCKEPSKCFLRYVPTRPLGEIQKKNNASDVSSTKIREAMHWLILKPGIAHELAESAVVNEALFKCLVHHRTLRLEARQLYPDDIKLQTEAYTAATRSKKVFPKVKERELRRMLKNILDRLKDEANAKAIEVAKEQERKARRGGLLKNFEAAMARQRKNFDDAKERQCQAWDKEHRRRQLWHKTGLTQIQNERAEQLTLLLRGATDAMRQYVKNANDESDRMYLDICKEAEGTMKQKIEDWIMARNELLDDYFKWESTVMRHRLENEGAELNLDSYIETCNTSMADWLSHIIDFCEETKGAMLALPNGEFERRVLQDRDMDNPKHRHKALLGAWKREADERQHQAIELQKEKEREQQRKAIEVQKANERKRKFDDAMDRIDHEAEEIQKAQAAHEESMAAKDRGRNRRMAKRQAVRNREFQERLAVSNREFQKRMAVSNREFQERMAERRAVQDREFKERMAERNREFKELMAERNREWNRKIAERRSARYQQDVEPSDHMDIDNENLAPTEEFDEPQRSSKRRKL